MYQKICSKCNTEKPATDFSIFGKSKDGLAAWCKPCVRESSTNGYQNNPIAKIRKRLGNLGIKMDYQQIQSYCAATSVLPQEYLEKWSVDKNGKVIIK